MHHINPDPRILIGFCFHKPLGPDLLYILLRVHRYLLCFCYVIVANMKLRKNDGVKFKITTTRNHRVYNCPYYRVVYLWERLPVVVQILASKSDFWKRIKVL